MFTRNPLRSGAATLGYVALIVLLGGCMRINAPTVSSTVPENDAVDVAVNQNISATFSEAMDPDTINSETFTLRHGTTQVSGSVSYTGVTATFNPTQDLLPNTLYTARITTGAMALDGKHWSSDRLAGDEYLHEGEHHSHWYDRDHQHGDGGGGAFWDRQSNRNGGG